MQNDKHRKRTGGGGRKSLRGKEFFRVVYYFILWYLFGSISNVYCKQFLTQTNDAVLLTFCQYIVSVILTCCVLLFTHKSKQQSTQESFINEQTAERESSILEISQHGWKIFFIAAIVNSFGHLMTNWSMADVAVSFTHTIKCTEPMFSLIFAILVFKQRISKLMAISLLPIILGTIFAAISEISYSHFGFVTAVASNLLFSTRNVFSKKFQNEYPAIRSSEFFLLLNLFSIIVIFPVWIFSSWYHHFFPSVNILNIGSEQFISNIIVIQNEEYYSVIYNLLMASGTHCIYNLTSLMILEYITPVGHSIGNSLRRVYIVIFTFIWFDHPITTMNVLGTAVAMIGVLLYAYASAKYSVYLEKRKRSKQVLAL